MRFEPFLCHPSHTVYKMNLLQHYTLARGQFKIVTEEEKWLHMYTNVRLFKAAKEVNF
jgi:hypothetical protein